MAVVILGPLSAIVPASHAQEKRPKLRISNAGFTITALPLLAAKDWGIFTANGLDMEVILMQSSLVPAALTQGDIDFQAGVGPASVNATMSGFATRAIWFSSDRISYWLMAKPQFKTLEALKSKKVAITGLGGTVHVAFLLALEKLGVSPKDFVLVSIAGQQIQQLISLESGYVDAALLSPPVTLGAQKKASTRSWTSDPWSRCPAVVSRRWPRPSKSGRLKPNASSARCSKPRTKSKNPSPEPST
jgi:ABC-type nitrate/sulfonate/bicarbonate transport system substrate-binding protein